jgi:hypothetical protein
MKAFIAVVLVVIVAGGLLGFTGPGHYVLNALGLATAGCPGQGC